MPVLILFTPVVAISAYTCEWRILFLCPLKSSCSFVFPFSVYCLSSQMKKSHTITFFFKSNFCFLYLYFFKAENWYQQGLFISIFSIASAHFWCGKLLIACCNESGSIKRITIELSLCWKWHIFQLTQFKWNFLPEKGYRNLDGSQEWWILGKENPQGC